MSQGYDVASLGNAIVDVIAATDDGFLAKHDIAKGIMTLVDEPRARQLLDVLGETRETAGGSAANTMAGLASLGGKGLFVGKVRNDALGEAFTKNMNEIGVRYVTETANSGPATACCLIAVTPDGQRSMNTFLGASRELSKADIDEAEIAKAEVLYVEGYLWDTPEAKEAIEIAMSAAKAAGKKVAFTLSDPFCVGRWRNEFRRLLDGKIDILFANEEEAKSLFEVDNFDDVLQPFHDWKGIAALTRSEKGCVIAHKGEVHVIDAAPVAKVVDTTGAGDQFAAGFLYGLTHGKSLADCGRLGSMAAAEVISHYGARPEVSLKELATKTGIL